MSWLRSHLREILPPGLVQRRLPITDAGRILLTFDDGPSPEVTPQVLDRLRSYGVRAVFFLVGRRILKAPDLVRRIVGEGHTIGNHSFAHGELSPFAVEACAADLVRCQDTIADTGGGVPTLYRPPLGRLTPATLLAPRRLGLTLMNWSLETNDWRCRSADDARLVADHIERTVADRDIVLLHDDNARVLNVLDRVLPTLAQRFQFAPRVRAA